MILYTQLLKPYAFLSLLDQDKIPLISAHLSSSFAISFFQLIANFYFWMSVPSMKANKGKRERKAASVGGKTQFK